MKKLYKLCLILFAVGLVMTIFGVAGGGQFDPGNYIASSSGYEGAYNSSDSVEDSENGFINSESLHLNNVDSISINIAAGKLNIMPGDTFLIEYKNVDNRYFDCDIYDETLQINMSLPDSLIAAVGSSSSYNPELVVYVPAGFEADDVYVNMSAGLCRIDSLNAEDMEISLSLGELVITDSRTEEFYADVSGGKIDAQGLSIKEGNMNVSAGELSVSGLQAKRLDANVSAGKAVISGNVTKSGSFNCDLGSLDIDLAGSQSDYTMDINVDLGKLSINGDSYNGNNYMSLEGNGNGADLSLNCSAGKIDLDFES